MRRIDLIKIILNKTNVTVILGCTPAHYANMRNKWHNWDQLQRRTVAVIDWIKITPADAREFFHGITFEDEAKAVSIACAAANKFGAYAYLTSDASRWQTGSAVVVDGGYSAP